MLLSVLFAIFQAAIALTGWESLKYLAKVILPIKLVLLSVVIVAFLTSSDPRFAWATVNRGEAGRGTTSPSGPRPSPAGI